MTTVTVSAARQREVAATEIHVARAAATVARGGPIAAVRAVERSSAAIAGSRQEDSAIGFHSRPIGISNHIGIEWSLRIVGVVQGIQRSIPIIRQNHNAIHAIYLCFGITDV